jgi:cell division protein FtsI/penicillin-binding protein 2
MRRSSLSPRPPARKPAISLRRVFLFGGFLGLWILVILGRLYSFQIIDYVKWVSKEQKQQEHTVRLPSERGTIFDRGRRPLAMSVPVDSAFAMPTEISDVSVTAHLLAPVLGVDAADLENRLQNLRSFCWIKRGISTEIASRLRSLDLRGVYFQKEMKRFYPKGPLAADVMGFVGLDDRGLAGLEYGLNREIAGRPSLVLMNEDARRQSFHSTAGKGEPGTDVVLTLDENIQYIAERALADAVEENQASSGVVVVENPSTGEILAMASQPTFDPNNFEKATPEERKNRAIQWVYEPGSMFKLVTYAGALEEGLISPDELIDCQNGSITLDGHVIHDDDEHFGVLTIQQALAHSSDVAAVKIGLRLGQERLYRYVRQFGFGSRTGIDLPGEEPGLVEPVSRWSGLSIGAISIGQEVGVTALQVITAYSAIANAGVLHPPRIIESLVQGAAVTAPQMSPIRRVVSERTADLMKHMFMEVVQEGTGRKAQLNGYSAAGKTGTAQKIVGGRYSHSSYVSSFVGFAPVEHPAIAVLVSIDSPTGQHHGAEVAAPVFKEVAEQTLAYLNVPKDRPVSMMAQSRTAVMPVSVLASNRTKLDTTATPSSAHLAETADAPPVPSSRYAADEDLKPISLTSKMAPVEGTVVLDKGPLVTVPDLAGLAERAAARQCSAAGLELVMSGSGLAAQQDPPAGWKVPARSKVEVWFTR